MNLQNKKIVIIGLGYVGLPLAVEFGKQFDTLGFDIDARRIAELQAGHDRTLETTTQELAQATRLRYTLDPAELMQCNVFIVTVPTPVDHDKRPDFTPLIKASQTVGRALKPGDKLRRLTTIPKITSGSTTAAADFVDALYQKITCAHLSPPGHRHQRSAGRRRHQVELSALQTRPGGRPLPPPSCWPAAASTTP